MSLKTTNTPKKEYPILAEGQHTAICVQVIDLWNQFNKFNENYQHKVKLVWETPDEKTVFTEEKWEQPFMVSADYTLSLADLSNLKPILESWRGKTFTEEEKDGFDIWSILWQACLIQVVHNKNKDGTKTFANIQNLMRLPKWMTVPKATNPLILFDIDNWNQETFDSLPKFIQDKM